VAVISKYVKIDPSHLKVNVERQDNLEVLEVKIELPDWVFTRERDGQTGFKELVAKAVAPSR
jgi:septum formation topological specificity factor MinE